MIWCAQHNLRTGRLTRGYLAGLTTLVLYVADAKDAHGWCRRIGHFRVRFGPVTINGSRRFASQRQRVARLEVGRAVLKTRESVLHRGGSWAGYQERPTRSAGCPRSTAIGHSRQMKENCGRRAANSSIHYSTQHVPPKHRWTRIKLRRTSPAITFSIRWTTRLSSNWGRD